MGHCPDGGSGYDATAVAAPPPLHLDAQEMCQALLRIDTTNPPGRERAAALALAGEFVPARGAGAEAGKAEGDEAVHVGLAADVLGREVMIAVDTAGAGPRPVLADKSPLKVSLARVSGRKTQAVAGGEEERRSLVEQAAEPAVGRLLPEHGLDLPAGLVTP